MKAKNKIQNSLGLIFMAVGFILIFTFVFALIGNSNGGGSSESQSTEKINYISFTVDETEYTSPKNWTWGQYVNSVYCDEFTIDNNYVLSQTGIVAIGNEKVLLNDKIIADTEYVSIILYSFSIGETSYNFESGMTWNDWKNSSFNKDNYYLIDNYIYLSETGVVTYNNSNVLKTDTIIANATYSYAETIYFELKVDSNGYNRCIAISGMTWQQWVASDYNYLDISISNGYVKVGNYYIHKFGTNEFVLSSDTIISGQSYTYRNEQFLFTIDNVSYTADNNMTWQQWVNSPYNTSNSAVVGSNITYNNYSGYIANNGSYVLKTDNIIANTNYTVDSTISFNIGNTTYNSYGAIVRPTWQSWVNSEFNTDNYVVVGDYIYSSQNGVVAYNGNNVLKTDNIVADRNYSLVETLSFTDYMGNYYRFINGMTWSQWLNSGFNTSTYNSGNNTIFATSGHNLVLFNDTGTVTVNDIIIANYEYNWQSPIAYDTATDILTVENTVYYVKRNATWSQWLENGDGISTNDFTIDSNNYIYTENGYVTYNGNFVVKADTVVRGATYTLTYNTYTITYKDGGNTTFSGIHESGYPTTHTYGTSTTLKSATKTGYTFGGWYTDSACTTATNGTLGATAYTSNITLYAKWTVNTYTITYNLNGGSVANFNPSSYTIETSLFILNNPTKTGYTFSGWTGTDLSNATTSVTVASGSTGNRSYTATWLANTYAITYKDGGNTTFSGTHANGYPTTHTYGTATTLKSATKTGYTFGGWYTNSACTTATNGTLGATAYTSNITLYAKWTLNTISFTIDNTSYTATSGMTWTQWVASAYNTANFTIDSNNNISSSNGLVTYNNVSVLNTDTIIANASYTIVSSTPQVQSPYFTYGGTNYYFESGMTWGDWISSAYNTLGFSNGGSGMGYKVVVFKTFYLVYDEVDKTPVIVSDLITDGHTYFLGG